MWELQCEGVAVSGSYGVRELMGMGIAVSGVVVWVGFDKGGYQVGGFW